MHYSTYDPSHLKKHSYTHTSEKPLKCGNCDYSTTTARLLNRHSYKHTKPYQCGSCNYSTFEAHRLKRHRCTGVKTYQKHVEKHFVEEGELICKENITEIEEVIEIGEVIQKSVFIEIGEIL